jgi:geranylgeranyl diphosphate synthase type I
VANNILEEKRRVGIPRHARCEDAPIGAIEGTLADFLASQIAALDSIDPALGCFARTARDLVLSGGKRLRPTFAYWGWRGVVGPREPVDVVLPALASLELMHTFALVHDDVMDNSATRRGGPTAHRIFAAQHAGAGRQGDPERFGSTSAILVGDLCLVWADQLLARTPLPAATLFEVRACYDRMRIEAVAGQYLDVLGETQPGAWSVERALVVARHKTASYTVQRPLQFGLALAGPAPAGGVEIDAVYAWYGAAVGEAFQLRDDLLGVFGDPAVTGKPAGDDLREGKRTLLLAVALERADRRGDDAARAAVEAAVGNPGLTAQEVERTRDVLTELGAVQAVEQRIAALTGSALDALAAAPVAAPAATQLAELAITATRRRR